MQNPALTAIPTVFGQVRKGVRHLDHLGTRALCNELVVFTPTASEMVELLAAAKNDMPLLASDATVLRVAASNPDCFWAMRRRGSSKASGFVAFLMLNDAGTDALLSGTLNAGSPDPRFLVGQNETPASIYVWALHARGMVTPALGLVMDKLQSPTYRAANFIARAATEEGAAFLTALGFLEHREANGLGFFHLQRRVGDSAPATRNAPRNRPVVRAKTVHKFDEFLQASSIRAAVYIGEELCPYAEEFDGNDFSATHVLGTVHEEPAGCLRIRYFADFAKIERVAVRDQFRGLGLGKEMVQFAIELCQRKGYCQFYVHARQDKIAFWRKFGFQLFAGQEFNFSDYAYVEMTANYPAHAAPISLGVDPMLTVRPEGAWEVPGILEYSNARAPGDYQRSARK